MRKLESKYRLNIASFVEDGHISDSNLTQLSDRFASYIDPCLELPVCLNCRKDNDDERLKLAFFSSNKNNAYGRPKNYAKISPNASPPHPLAFSFSLPPSPSPFVSLCLPPPSNPVSSRSRARRCYLVPHRLPCQSVMSLPPAQRAIVRLSTRRPTPIRRLPPHQPGRRGLALPLARAGRAAASTPPSAQSSLHGYIRSGSLPPP